MNDKTCPYCGGIAIIHKIPCIHVIIYKCLQCNKEFEEQRKVEAPE